MRCVGRGAQGEARNQQRAGRQVGQGELQNLTVARRLPDRRADDRQRVAAGGRGVGVAQRKQERCPR